MKNLSYYSFKDTESDGLNLNSRASDERPLMINCAGTISLSSPFTTYNPTGRQDYYLMYVAEGRLRLGEDMAGQTVGAGSAVIFPPEYKYTYSFSGDGTISYYFVHFTGSHTKAVMESVGIGELPCVLEAKNMEEICAMFGRLFASFGYDKQFFELSSASELGGILSAIARSHFTKDKDKPLSRSIGYINAFYTEDIRIPALAAMEGLSPSRYNTLFRESMGISAQGYITDLRLKAAASLLKSTDLDIKEVGAAVGYDDNHFFSKIFKKYYLLSPKQYREKDAEK